MSKYAIDIIRAAQAAGRVVTISEPKRTSASLQIEALVAESKKSPRAQRSAKRALPTQIDLNYTLLTSTPEKLSFFIHGEPIPKGRPRFSIEWNKFVLAMKKSDYKEIYKSIIAAILVTTPQRTKDYEKRIFSIVKHIGNEHFLERNCSINLDFMMKNPRKADVDNLGKSVLDGFNESLYVDDRSCFRIVACKHQAEAFPRTHPLLASLSLRDGGDGVGTLVSIEHHPPTH